MVKYKNIAVFTDWTFKEYATADCVENYLGKCRVDLLRNLYKRGHDEIAKKPEAMEHSHSGIYNTEIYSGKVNTNSSVAIIFFYNTVFIKKI